MLDKKPHQVPLSEWPTGWLIMETATLLIEEGKDTTGCYMYISEEQRAFSGWPSSDESRRNYIDQARKKSLQ